jgi:hypothetical protein
MSSVPYGRLALIICLFISTGFSNMQAQTITPYTLNNGGGSAATMEWSIGESVSIANFIASGYSLNTGALQPMSSIVNAINEYGPSVFGTQITIGPNPTFNLLHIKARFNQAGSLSYQLIDAKSTIVFTQEVGTIFSSYDKDILMENYPSGVFYMKVYFKPSNGNTKTGIYKIIKL